MEGSLGEPMGIPSAKWTLREAEEEVGIYLLKKVLLSESGLALCLRFQVYKKSASAPDIWEIYYLCRDAQVQHHQPDCVVMWRVRN